MKERMKKATFMLYHRDTEKVLSELQEKGMVHIDINDVEESGQLNELVAHITKLENILHEADASQKPLSDKSAEDVIDQYDRISQEIAELNELKEKLQKDFRILKPWGNIKWKSINRIEEKNWSFSFYIAPGNSFNQIADDPYILEIARHGGNVYFVNITPVDKAKSLPFEQLDLPRKPLGEIGKELSETEEHIIRLEQQKTSLGHYMPVLREYLNKKRDELLLMNAQIGMESTGEGTIKFITAWYPARDEDKIRQELDKMDLAYEMANPSDQDSVPIILKNNPYNKVFENITRVYQLPNYHELDLTPFIGFFYPIFFAYCLGDAGYGIVLMGLSFYALSGPLKKMPTVGWLGVVLGMLTTVVGIVKSGTVFGLSISEAREIPLFDVLSDYIFITDDQNFVFNAFNVSLMIGLVQILTGVILSFYRKLKYQSFATAIPMMAKFFIIISAVTLFLGGSQGTAILVPFVGAAKIGLITGVIVLLFTHDFSTPIFSRVMQGFLEVFFVFTGILGDSLSYIRLFALGVSSSILGLVVNQIGAPLLEGGILSIIGGAVFLLFGHALNFAIAFLGALIHPLRLTFVEFYGNAQFEGGGKEYKPFKKTSTESVN